MSPPKTKRDLCRTALRNLELRTAYHSMVLLAKVFEKPFWFFEQQRGRLFNLVENSRSEK
jgi:hypothetical protein